MQPQDWNTLQNEIQAKCITYEYADSGDTTLAQYIINLLKIGSSPDHVNQELQQLVGSDYNTDLTGWIFARANELENPSTATQQQQQESATPAKSSSEAGSRPRGNRIFAQAIGNLNGSTQHNSRVNRSRSRSPEQQRRGQERERSPYRNGHDDRGRGQGINQRLSSGRQVQFVESNGKQDSRPSVFDRLGTSRPSTATQKAERCKYWPSCSQGESCVYFHPKTICPDFPKCSKPANECMFIHPEVSAPQQQQPQLSLATPQMPQMPMKRPIPCRFYPYCTNPMCPFMHPEQPTGATGAPGAPVPSGPVKRVPIPCKMGDKCKRPGCHFIHPGDEEQQPVSEILCKYDGACTRPGCFYKHTVPPKSFSGGNRSLVLNKKEPGSLSERQFSVVDDDEVERVVLGESADIIKKDTTTSSSPPSNEKKGEESNAMEM
ncbi:hypothetical protein BDB00DRAFT_817181 [Zychaea mexicana]|uniref:uncharacterized protein n=1 Tax=Zychaea mexicana TaxID=64656 RepID=UPI0022FE0F7F|nr:uncharacterized protein BDB00DRAFT_817181 [Zychaea mexicana]KAI9494816.1 hypothetical protein BDB00DRAFT_817181 [Zychaea mexicana]